MVLSLADRDGLSLDRSYISIWLEHLHSSLAHTGGSQRVAVEYAQLLQDPAGQLQRLAARLGLRFDRAAVETTNYVSDFLDPSLCHYREGLDNLQVDPDVVALYRTLSALAADTLEFDSAHVATSINAIGGILASYSAAWNFDHDQSSAWSTAVAQLKRRFARGS